MNIKAPKPGFLPQIFLEATQPHFATQSMGKPQMLLGCIEFLSLVDLSVRSCILNY